MRTNKRLINALQNTALILLTASALFLLAKTPLLPDGWLNRVTPPSALAVQPVQAAAGELSGLLGSVHLMITDDSEYGRYGRLCVEESDPLLQQVIPAFREALGSAAEMESVTQPAFRNALSGSSLYVGLLSGLPLAAVAACLDETAPFDCSVCALALAVRSEDTVDLYLPGEDGTVFRCTTALPVSAVRAVCASVAPNGSAFAYETGYTTLAPYTFLAAEVEQPPDLQSDIPPGFTAYNLLTTLDFNPHTNSRYIDRDGAEVVEESPRTVRISPDGTVYYTGSGPVSLRLYRLPAESSGLPEALCAAKNLASTLAGGTGASPLYLCGVEETEKGYIIRFGYQCSGIPVSFPDEADALSVTVSGVSITAFSYRCRAYTPLASDAGSLLPPAMAAAIASLYSGGGLRLAYIDRADRPLSAVWLAG
ncbi:MAG: hypothetical protein K2O18_16150 [Oscillospiraceae bacterium]|nr:hypothetical protein [Oscillospiraceae bacterium]